MPPRPRVPPWPNRRLPPPGPQPLLRRSLTSTTSAGSSWSRAAHAVFLGHADGVLRLALSPEDALLHTPASNRALARALEPVLGTSPQLRFEAVATDGAETLRQRSERQRGARQEAAESAFMADPGVQQLIQRHGATLVPDSIRPHDE